MTQEDKKLRLLKPPPESFKIATLEDLYEEWEADVRRAKITVVPDELDDTEGEQ